MWPEGGPRRGAAELAEALRSRAAHLTGADWEVPATAAMMREAADRLEDLNERIAMLMTVADVALDEATKRRV